MPIKKSPDTVGSKININNYLVVLLIIAAFIIGSLYQKVKYLEKGASLGTTTQQQEVPNPNQQAEAEPVLTIEKVKEAFNKSAIKFGNVNNKVIFIEVADPSCPYCHVAAGKNAELNKEIDKQTGRQQFTLVTDGGSYIAPVVEMKKLVDKKLAAFAWLYTNGHGNGEMGTKALYCANEKGKFWPVHDSLMTNEGYKLLNETVRNDKAKSAELAQFLSSVIDFNEMKSCLESGKYDGRLAEDSVIASGLGISGTPGFIINSTKFAGAYSFKDMEPAVTESLK